MSIVGTLENETIIVGALEVESEVTDMAFGWIKIVDVLPQSLPDTVGSKVYQDFPNNTVLQSATSSTRLVIVSVRASYPIVKVNGVQSTLIQSADFGHYQGTVAITLPAQASLLYIVDAETVTPNDVDGALDTVLITLDVPPQVMTLQFTGGYPGTQTELKAGDSFQITGTLDQSSDRIEIIDFGAFVPVVVVIPTGTSFTISGTIADRGTTLQALAARIRARDPSTLAFGPTRDTNTGGGTVNGVNLVNLNNLYPSVSFGSIVYPAGQGALKSFEQATIPITLANHTSFVYDSPNAELNVLTSLVTSAVVERVGGTYNVTTNNFRATATRSANAAQTVLQAVVKIANVAASLTVTIPAARLRSGGNNGTAIQNHTITITSNQELLSAPSMSPAASAGTLTGPGFVGGPSVWTRTLQVHDNDSKGTFAWVTPLATNLAGLTTSIIATNPNYVLGGFVQRNLTFSAFATTTLMGVSVVDFTKLQAGIFTSTNQTALKQPVGTSPPVIDGYTIAALAVNPTTVIWLDTTAAAANSSGTAQITAVEEIV